MPGPKEVAEAAKLVWENRAAIVAALAQFRRWWRRSRVLMIGPGGTGKTTLARILSGEFDWLADSPWRYDEDVAARSYRVGGRAPAEVVVLPGQEHRRSATWAAVIENLAAGKYHGVVVVGSFGYHSFNRISYKQHRLYRGNKARFLADYTRDRREDEVRCLRNLTPGLAACPRRVWLATVATKLDLWHPEEAEAVDWYQAGEYGQAVAAAVSGSAAVRHEFVPVSSVIGNFVTERGEPLRANAGGFDHRAQVLSVRRLVAVLEGLRDWGRA